MSIESLPPGLQKRFRKICQDKHIEPSEAVHEAILVWICYNESARGN